MKDGVSQKGKEEDSSLNVTYYDYHLPDLSQKDIQVTALLRTSVSSALILSCLVLQRINKMI